MNRILLSIDKLNRFSGTESTLMDIAEHFHRLGWQVDLVTRMLGSAYQQRVDQLQQQGRFNCYLEDVHPLSAEYQLVWICQGYMSAAMIDILHKGEISGVYLFQHYYSYADLDLPYGSELENKLAWRSLAVSTISYTKLALKGVDQRKLQIFPLSVTNDFIQYPVRETLPALRKILLVTASQIDEIKQLSEHLGANGVSLEVMSPDQVSQQVTASFLSEYQVVMGESRIAAQALSLGIPVFVTDMVYGKDYLNDASLDIHVDWHLTADVDFTVASPENLAVTLTDNYPEAWRWTQNFRSGIIHEWSLSRQLDEIVTQLPPPASPEISLSEAASLTLHRKVIANEANQARGLELWLQKRQPSAARVQVLSAFIQQMPQAGDIGLVIMDASGNAEQLAVTQESLNHQYFPLQSVQTVTDSQQLARVINETSHDSLLVVNAGTVLLPHAALLFAEHRLRQPDTALWYCDSIHGTELRLAQPLLKPPFNLDLLRSQPYIGEQLLFNVAKIRDLGGLDVQYSRLGLIDLVWKTIEAYGISQVGHIAEALLQIPQSYDEWLKLPEVYAENTAVVSAHLQRCGLNATLETGLTNGVHRVKFAHPEQPLVSVIIPTRDRLPLLRRCLESLMEKTRWQNYEIVLVDNASSDVDACEYLNELAALNLDQIRVLRWTEPFNYSAINNYAASEARGDLLLFLNNDINVIDEEWMGALAEHALRPEIGLVGAHLQYHDGRTQHAGLITGVGLGVSWIYNGVPDTSPGYLSRLKTVHNVTAVSAACLMMRREVFKELEGFSANEFPVYFGDIDLALKARQAGYLTVWTPYARLEHMAGATRILDQKTGVPVTPGDDVFDTLREKWQGSLCDDISYNPHLVRLGNPFSLGLRQAALQNPLPGRPLPVMMAGYKNVTGCGNYRVIKPFTALEGQLVLEGGLMHGIPSVMEVAALQPDTILMELIFDPEVEKRIRQFKQVSKPKIIMEYDDYVLNLPMKSVFRKKIPKNIASDLRRTTALADWLVVSTEPLAEAYAYLHHDIRVAKNRLGVDIWEPLKSLRQQGKKLRVGWAGGSSHTGDLEILLPFIRELEDEVEWVFMGMRPEGVKCEFHIGVPFEYYPEKLASLNLDLALVPLEQHFFNECKSNLRLLELGACGVPVICTDIEPYRCDLPVTRVQNRYKDWMNAIREHLADRDGLAARGDALRAAVHRDWMLRDEGLDDWKRAWLQN